MLPLLLFRDYVCCSVEGRQCSLPWGCRQFADRRGGQQWEKFGHHPKVAECERKREPHVHICSFATAVPHAEKPNHVALLGAAKTGPDCTHGSLFLHVFSCLWIVCSHPSPIICSSVGTLVFTKLLCVQQQHLRGQIGSLHGNKFSHMLNFKLMCLPSTRTYDCWAKE